MRVLNVHQRELAASPEAVGRLIDRLGSEEDAIWPDPNWPPMRLDRPLQAGAAGGHGPIRYVVEEYAPGRRVVFRFTAPRGFVGTHRFEVEPTMAGSLLCHVLEMEATGAARLSWPLVFRPLHDALIEDALDRAQRARGREPARAARWSLYVRFLRFLLRRRRRGPRAG